MKIISDSKTQRIAIQCDNIDEFEYLSFELIDIQTETE